MDGCLSARKVGRLSHSPKLLGDVPLEIFIGMPTPSKLGAPAAQDVAEEPLS